MLVFLSLAGFQFSFNSLVSWYFPLISWCMAGWLTGDTLSTVLQSTAEYCSMSLLVRGCRPVWDRPMTTLSKREWCHQTVRIFSTNCVQPAGWLTGNTLRRAEQHKMRRLLAAQFMPIFLLILRILMFCDKMYRILTFRDKKYRNLTFRNKTELYWPVLQQNNADTCLRC